MTIKTLAAAMAFSLTPIIAFASGCGAYGKQEITMSCAAGMVFDAGSHACVSGVNS